MTHINYNCEVRAFRFSSLSDSTCEVIGYNRLPDEKETHLVIPCVDPQGRTVVAIANQAFSHFTELSSVTIPDTVEYIGKRAFAFCTSLTTIRTGRHSRLSHIGDRAFIGCEQLIVLSLGHLYGNLICGKKAFAHCNSLRAVVLPSGMAEISEGMFEGCRALTYISLPEHLQTIHMAAFSACVALPMIALPSSVRRIDESAFSFCGRLQTVILPESECIISATAFIDCPAKPDFMRAC